jgi:hypothetical protein
MIVLFVCLVASMVIAAVRLSSTPEEVIGDRFHGLPPAFIAEHRAEYGAAKGAGAEP